MVDGELEDAAQTARTTEPVDGQPKEKTTAEAASEKVKEGEYQEPGSGVRFGKDDDEESVDPDLFAAVWEALYWEASTRWGDHWQLTEKESKVLGRRTEAALKDIIPELKGMGPSGRFLLSFGLITGARIAATVVKNTQKHAQKKSQPQENGARRNTGDAGPTKGGENDVVKFPPFPGVPRTDSEFQPDEGDGSRPSG